MFATTALIAHTRIAQVTMLVILLVATVLLALGLLGADEAEAGVRCTRAC
jgi:hypothetical protein